MRSRLRVTTVLADAREPSETRLAQADGHAVLGTRSIAVPPVSPA